PDQYVIVPDAFGRHDATVERHHRLGKARRASLSREPSPICKLVVATELAAATKMIGDIGLVVAQDIDAEHTIVDDGRRRLALMMDTDQNRRCAAVGGDR